MIKCQKKNSEGAITEDLSNLIKHHHPKLHISGEYNNSLPDIPKALKNSQKRLQTSRDIHDLGINNKDLVLNTNKNIQQKQQSHKLIATNKKINDPQEALPIDSRRDLSTRNKGRREEEEGEGSANNIEEGVTVTYILRKLDLNEIVGGV